MNRRNFLLGLWCLPAAIVAVMKKPQRVQTIRITGHRHVLDIGKRGKQGSLLSPKLANQIMDRINRLGSNPPKT